MPLLVGEAQHICLEVNPPDTASTSCAVACCTSFDGCSCRVLAFHFDLKRNPFGPMQLLLGAGSPGEVQEAWHVVPGPRGCRHRFVMHPIGVSKHTMNTGCVSQASDHA